MKKISLIASALVASTALFAQNQPQLRTPMSVEPRFGIKGGVNIAKMDNDGFSSGSNFRSESKTGYYAGFLANIPISGNFRFQPEVVYSRQGGKNTQSNGVGGGSSSYAMNLDYINIPLMLQMQSAGGFFAELGPQVGFLISGKSKGISSGNNAEIDIKNQLSKMDIAAVGGIGYLSRVGLGINARYNYGLKNVLDDKASTYTSGQKLKNRGFQIGLFYQFGASE